MLQVVELGSACDESPQHFIHSRINLARGRFWAKWTWLRLARILIDRGADLTTQNNDGVGSTIVFRNVQTAFLAA
jgi:hypothetical protein